MPNQCVIAFYDSVSKVKEALDELEQNGFPIDRLSLITQNREIEKELYRPTDNVGNAAKLGAVAGSSLGWVIGVLADAAVVWIPGVGPGLAVGYLASTALLGGIEGVVAGATGGGVLVTLVDWGISRQHIRKYEKKLKDGNYLLMVDSSSKEAARAKNILRNAERRK
ncbi:2-oxobutyrate oxidase [cyanobacterium TDX16]|nr:2-oxobutyrate oxidase [cyanobacterium TDX16]